MYIYIYILIVFCPSGLGLGVEGLGHRRPSADKSLTSADGSVVGDDIRLAASKLKLLTTKDTV